MTNNNTKPLNPYGSRELPSNSITSLISLLNMGLVVLVALIVMKLRFKSKQPPDDL